MGLPREGLKPPSFLRTFGVERHAQPGTLGWALVGLEMLPHEDVLRLVLDGQHRATNCGRKGGEGEAQGLEDGAWERQQQQGQSRGTAAGHEPRGERGAPTQSSAGERRGLTRGGLVQGRGLHFRVLCCTQGQPGTSLLLQLPLPFWHLRMASFCPRVISMWKV